MSQVSDVALVGALSLARFAGARAPVASAVRTMRQRAQGFMRVEQPALRGQGASDLLRQAQYEPCLGQVQGDDLHHLFVTECQGGREGAVCIHQELAPIAKEMSHFAITRNVRNRNHDTVLCKSRDSGPILRTLLNQLRPISNISASSALHVVCLFACVPTGSIEGDLRPMARI